MSEKVNAASNDDPRTLARQVTLARLKQLQRRHKKAVDYLAQLEDERVILYREARDNGITFKAIGDVFGISEAAVLQKLRRADNFTELAETGA